jgi:AAHS family 4-hydroxybenzoate transporter-like MFS transporter
MAASVDIGHVIDEGRWGGYQKWLIFLTALTIVFDGIDNQLLGIVIPTIMRDWHVPRDAFASVVALGYAGMMTGGAIAGLAGDRWGRRTALVATMFVFGSMTIAASLVHDTTALGWLRFAAGLGLGGAMPRPQSRRYACISTLPASLPRTTHRTPSTRPHYVRSSMIRRR